MKKKLISTYILSILLFLVAFYIMIWHPKTDWYKAFFYAGLICIMAIGNMTGKEKVWGERNIKDTVNLLIGLTVLVLTSIFLYKYGDYISREVFMAVAFGSLVYVHISVGHKIYKKLKEEINQSQEGEKK